MATKKSKFYVVWKGRKIGVFDSWEICKAQVTGTPGAKFKSYPTKALAENAFKNPPSVLTQKIKSKTILSAHHPPIEKSIVVDGAWNTKTGIIEYQGVRLDNKELLFKMGPYTDGTNNIAEFLALTHALAYCYKRELDYDIYSDSQTAIKWVKEKKANTKHPRRNSNKTTFELIDRAIAWLNQHNYSNTICKWQTEKWGENPADFGRK